MRIANALRLRRGTSCIGLLLLAACHSAPELQPDEAASVPSSMPPPACSTALALPPPVLKLPRTDSPRKPSRDGGDVDISQIHTVNRPLQDIGIWNEAADGWSVLALEVGSDRARSIAVRLHDVHLPAAAALWLCSADGKLREGPYRQKADGELWSEALASSHARIEVWAPTRERERVSALLADVYGGYR